jgi:hypothetical protein
VISECLGSIFLLEDQSMEQVFNEFLSARAVSINVIEFQSHKLDVLARQVLNIVFFLL